MFENKLHWFCFSFVGTSLKLEPNCTTSTYTGYPTKNITMENIKENKRVSGVNNGAVLIGIFYLGYMKKSDFIGEEQIDE